MGIRERERDCHVCGKLGMFMVMRAYLTISFICDTRNFNFLSTHCECVMIPSMQLIGDCLLALGCSVVIGREAELYSGENVENWMRERIYEGCVYVWCVGVYIMIVRW